MDTGLSKKMKQDNFEQLPYFDVLLNKVFAYYATIWMDKRIEEFTKLGLKTLLTLTALNNQKNGSMLYTS